MLTPSYSELMDVIKQGGKVDPRVASRYTVVLAAAKRARQLTEGMEPLTYAPTDRAVSIAVKEMSEGKLRVKVQDDIMDGSYERLIKDQYKYRTITALSKDDLREDLKDDYATARTYTTEEDDDVPSDIFQDDDPFAETAAVEVPDDVDTDANAAIDEEAEDFGIYEDEESAYSEDSFDE